ncbi:MAG: hypothetical protein PQJ46_02355 [Spirochaetales bacterium]|nr:hypothetical protein [Spirochaetales bacterium]
MIVHILVDVILIGIIILWIINRGIKAHRLINEWANKKNLKINKIKFLFINTFVGFHKNMKYYVEVQRKKDNKYLIYTLNLGNFWFEPFSLDKIKEDIDII